ncbi:hypothetical protein [Streptomyces sp. NPDC101166]|uniref:hypothetical protein n=1 Tax=Streptomyces sp. NPDC101166 TaxID=3366120 RepID=UPI00382E83F8
MTRRQLRARAGALAALGAASALGSPTARASAAPKEPNGLPSRMTGTVDPARFTVSRRACLTAFFDQPLRGRHQPLLDGPSLLHPDVRFVG